MAPAPDWQLRRLAHAHPFAVDAASAALVTMIGLVVHFYQQEWQEMGFREPRWWTVLLVAVACAPVAWRRRRPIAALPAALALQVLVDVLLINGPSWIAVGVTTYSIGAHASGVLRLRVVAAASVVVVGILAFAVAFHEPALPLGDAVGLSAILAVCYLAGEVLRRRRLEVATLAARAERAERERELLATQRVVEERGRIARDLHDIVAHSVSVMVIQATAARRNVERNPAAAAELLENIEATGRRTMGELRQILGVLREEGDDPRTRPLLPDLDSLAQSIPELDVKVTRTGSLDAVPAGVALSAYRVVQEALTNAHRHGGPRVKVDVQVDCTPERVDVFVADDGRGASTQMRANGGYGLIGMGERVAAFGGTLHTGPRRAGGWLVRAYFPLHREHAG